MLRRAAEILGQASGLAGAGLAAACCIGIPAVLSAAGAVGLGFLIHDAYLFPIFAGFVGLGLWLLHRSTRRHGDRRPFRLALAGGLVALSGLWLLVTGILPTGIILYAGLAILVAGNLWDFVNGRHQRNGLTPEPKSASGLAGGSAPLRGLDPARRAALGASVAVAAGAVFYGLYKSVDAVVPEAAAGAIACWGANTCKGQTACATAFNACTGQNQCKGQGYIFLPEKECYAKGCVPLTGSEGDPSRS